MYIVVLVYLLCYIIPAMILDILQIRYIRFHATQKPVILNSNDYVMAANYAITRHKLSLIEHTLTFALLLFWLSLGIPYLLQICDTQLTSSFGTDWLVLMCFSAIHAILHIPMTLAHKRIDTTYGFNKQSFRDLCIDGVKMVCLSGILLGILFALLLWIMETMSLWWIVGFVAMFCLLLLMQILYPTLIAPMFNMITPLQNEALSARIQELLRCVGFQSSGIFVIDASKRDGRLNAYFGGLGSAKRVILFDTLLERISEDGLIAILGHELGHFKHGDLIRNLIVSAGIFFILFLIMGLFFHSLCLYLGLPPTDSTILILAILLLPVLLFLFMPIQSYFSRKAEYRADAFGASCVSNKALRDALVRLVNENKAFPYSHPAYIFFYYSHPPLLERLKALGGFCMIEIDLLLRIAIAFLKDMNLEEFKKLVYETQFLLADINSFESEKLPKDSQMQTRKPANPIESQTAEFRITSPRYEAEILLGHILNMTRVQLHTNGKKEITDFDKQRYFKLLAMRKNGVPLEYLIHKASFYDMELYIDNNVLIPRPETELLVEHALHIIDSYNITHFVEIGVGSGAISAAILRNRADVCGIATDISKEALNVARHNISQLGLDNRCEFLESDLLGSPYLIMHKPVTLLISNPPYIANDYPLNQEVLCEPHVALFGGHRGDEILRKLITQAREKQIQFLACEMGYDQRESMQEALAQAGYEATFYKDYAGFDRGFVARLRK